MAAEAAGEPGWWAMSQRHQSARRPSGGCMWPSTAALVAARTHRVARSRLASAESPCCARLLATSRASRRSPSTLVLSVSSAAPSVPPFLHTCYCFGPIQLPAFRASAVGYPYPIHSTNTYSMQGLQIHYLASIYDTCRHRPQWRPGNKMDTHPLGGYEVGAVVLT